MDEHQLREKLTEYKFYHIIQLTESLYTPGEPKHVPAQKLALQALGKLDLKGKRVLDIGCRDGLFSFEAERMGSLEVIGIDNDLSKPALEFLIPYFKSGVRMFEMNLFDLSPAAFGLFDVVILAGVLYHLRYPFWAMKIIRDVLKKDGRLLIETAIWRGDRHHAVLYCPTGSESPYEPTSCSFFNEKGLVDSLQSLGVAVDSVRYLYGQTGLASIYGRSRRIARTLLKRMHGIRVRSNIDRAVFLCHVAGTTPDGQVASYWNGLHDIHTRQG